MRAATYQRLRRIETGTRRDPELEHLAITTLDQANTQNAALHP